MSTLTTPRLSRSSSKLILRKSITVCSIITRAVKKVRTRSSISWFNRNNKIIKVIVIIMFCRRMWPTIRSTSSKNCKTMILKSSWNLKLIICWATINPRTVSVLDRNISKLFRKTGRLWSTSPNCSSSCRRTILISRSTLIRSFCRRIGRSLAIIILTAIWKARLVRIWMKIMLRFRWRWFEISRCIRSFRNTVYYRTCRKIKWHWSRFRMWSEPSLLTISTTTDRKHLRSS